MQEEPTNEDFRSWICWHLDKVVVNASKAVSRVGAEASARGAYQSSRTIIVTLEVVQKHFDAGLDLALGELRRVFRITNLDSADLRRITEDELRKFAGSMKAAAKLEKLQAIAGRPLAQIDEQVAEFDERLEFALRQFDVGFLAPPEPEVPPTMENKIEIGTMIGSAIQQDTTDSSQGVSIALDVESAEEALRRFADALRASDVPSDKLREAEADIKTIQAQLEKPSPSKSIIAEAGQSLRSLTEGVLAGALTPPAVAAALALWAALGLG